MNTSPPERGAPGQLPGRGLLFGILSALAGVKLRVREEREAGCALEREMQNLKPNVQQKTQDSVLPWGCRGTGRGTRLWGAREQGQSPGDSSLGLGPSAHPAMSQLRDMRQSL
jgi:hypothetical protein